MDCIEILIQHFSGEVAGCIFQVTRGNYSTALDPREDKCSQPDQDPPSSIRSSRVAPPSGC